MARTCPLGACDGTGMVVDETTRTASHCRCRAQLVAERRAKGLSAVIPKRYRGASFDRPPVSDMPRPQIVAEVRRFARTIDEQLDEGRGLWLQGPVGTGKTTLAMIVSRTALEAGRTVAIYSLPRLLTEIRTTFDEGSERRYEELLGQLAEVDLLHLDDVGAEKTSPWVLEQLYSIVNTRYEEQRSIVLTTNLDDQELAEQIGARTTSRLEEMCDILPIGGHDRRRQGAVADDEPAGEPGFGAPLWDVA
ncbi:ATP-binding protein [Conexibacter sp. SYSU D00693]|uniref:ATP-binding protein n=1 Tax=Conexibacter sp. SYSU D00693 TaxID=2812560 RepID=UPI00196AA155|nr:ATP-binding protein [Conexibacter sp. SYSU D00693]